ncbi:TetR/AcrR family transcriptional regulator [Pimelobacter simplex]|uniref:TetR/AcrR family transcriptional regulator n=1 Tax=Nocardioides simplex TaxID=2045 RepID=UPI0019321D77|nr:TetR/AcrR family transcriptional regulator [Pimelobacter simplex]
MSETRRRPGGRSADVRERVRQATLDLLGEVGYEHLQLTEVAARSGVNKTTVYRRWPAKPQLVADLLTDLADEQVPTPDTGTLAGDLEAMLVQVTTVLELPPVRAVLRAVLTLADDDPEVDQLRRTFWDRQLDDAAVVVVRGRERGELAPDTDPRLFLERVFGPVYFRILVAGRGFSRTELATLSRTVR